MAFLAPLVEGLGAAGAAGGEAGLFGGRAAAGLFGGSKGETALNIAGSLGGAHKNISKQLFQPTHLSPNNPMPEYHNPLGEA